MTDEEDWPEPGDYGTEVELDFGYIIFGFVVWTLTVVTASIFFPEKLAEVNQSTPLPVITGAAMVFMGAVAAAAKVAREGSL